MAVSLEKKPSEKFQKSKNFENLDLKINQVFQFPSRYNNLSLLEVLVEAKTGYIFPYVIFEPLSIANDRCINDQISFGEFIDFTFGEIYFLRGIGEKKYKLFVNAMGLIADSK